MFCFFFQRYAQRAKVDKTGLDLIRHYFEINGNFVFDVKRRGTELYLQGVAEEGLLLGTMLENKVVIVRTFVGWDGTFKDQYNDMHPMMEIIDEMQHSEEYNLPHVPCSFMGCV